MNDKDHKTQVKEFLQQNFTPGTPDAANFKRDLPGLLQFLWHSFPEDCISAFDLDDILHSLGYKKHLWVQEEIFEDISNKKKTVIVKKYPVHGYCLVSPFDLDTVKTVTAIGENMTKV